MWLSAFTLCYLSLCSIQDVTSTNNIPVFIIDYDGISKDINIVSNPFHKFTDNQFKNLIEECANKADFLIIYVEDKLSPEDLSGKDKSGTPFGNLKRKLSQQKVKYIPLVTDPYGTITSVMAPQHSSIVHITYPETTGLSNLHIQKIKYLYVFLDETGNVTRTEQLRTHDNIIERVYLELRQNVTGKIMGVYLGKSNPVHVKHYEPNFSKDKLKRVDIDKTVFLRSPKALFRFKHISAESYLRSFSHERPFIADEIVKGNGMSTRMAYSDFLLQFEFSFDDERWTLENVTLLENDREVGRTALRVSAPLGHSFCCGEPIQIINENDGTVVKLSSYRIQPFPPDGTEPKRWFLKNAANSGGYQRKKYLRDDEDGDAPAEVPDAPPPPADAAPSTSDNQAFGSPVHCGPYFSFVLISALLIVALFLSILLFGLTSMMSLQTNDSFDDSSGKALVIGAVAET